jgi:glycosyltransferase
MSDKRLGIIMPSFNDPRVTMAIRSVREIDDVGMVRLIVIDGGSNPNIVDNIRRALRPEDVLVSEADKGIFDALNKGLDRCQEPYLGWLGSDDLFTGRMKVSEILAVLQNADLLVGDVGMYRDNRITRVTRAAPCARGLWRIGLHNPHFSTFGRKDLLTSDRFEVGLRSADIGYFLRAFAKSPRVVAVSRIVTLQGEGGYSTQSFKAILRSNAELRRVYSSYAPMGLGALAVLVKLIYKSMERARCSIWKLYVDEVVTWKV